MSAPSITPEIIYECKDYVAINKPHGLLVHRSSIAKDATEFALQIVRDHLKQRVFLAHRLDRKTSGVLLFAKNKESISWIENQFRSQLVDKTYLALVRGFIKDAGTIDYALNNNGKIQNAVTHYKLLKQYEINVPSGTFSTSRYSIIKCKPETGRHHQIRKHLAHIFHPIIGDRPHGCNKQNKLWKERFNVTHMFLHAESLQFEHPSKGKIAIHAKKSSEIKLGLERLDSLNVI